MTVQNTPLRVPRLTADRLIGAMVALSVFGVQAGWTVFLCWFALRLLEPD